MSSKNIRSILIKTCMSNIQKEMGHLEHWLMNLSDTNLPDDSETISRLSEKISNQLSNQQIAIDNILERLDSMEGFRNSTREVFIEKCPDPYIDNSREPIIENDISELYTVHKENSVEVEEVEEVEEGEVEEGEVEEGEVEEVEQVEEGEVEGEQVEGEEQEEEVELEEGESIELEEFIYNKVKYYKDGENFIYSIHNDEPSDNPVGYWKEKTKLVAFYKNK